MNQYKILFKTSSSLEANCYGLATGCRKLYFSFAGCRKPKKVEKHWPSSIGQLWEFPQRGKQGKFIKKVAILWAI